MSGEGSPFSVPAAFGRFRVLHQIGAGSLGPVFHAEDPTKGVAVAVKVIRLNLPPEKAHEVADGLRVLRDRLPSHPAIAAILDSGLHEVSPYIVSAFAPGQSLDVALREFGPAVLPDAVPRLRALAAGLDAAAESWSWHGNLHPRDVLIDDEHSLIVGMGVAPVLEGAGARVPMRRPYTAPEVIAGRSTSPASDQYALAALAFEWILGRRAPGTAGTALNVPALPGVDDDALAAAFGSALAVDPTARFKSCAAFVQALEEAVRDSTLAARSDETRRQRRRTAATLPLLDDEAREPQTERADAEPASERVHDRDSHDEAAVRAEVDAVAEAVADLLMAREAAVELPPIAPVAPAVSQVDEAPVRPPADHGSPLFDMEPIDAPASAPVAWQGSLGGTPIEPPAKRGFGGSALVAALLLGAAIGAGVMFGISRTSSPAPLPSREFTDAALPTDAAAAGAESGGAAARGAATPGPADARKSEAAPPAESGVAPAARTESPVVESPAAPVSSGGSLLVRSTPAGAEVSVNGIAKGVTPLTLRDLPLGTHTVTVQRPGFARIEQRIPLTRARPSRSVDARLVAERAAPVVESRPASPRATTGTLTVDSRPSGSQVTIDGREVGTTPLTLTDVAPGSRTVRITRPGYRAWTTTVVVEAGKSARVAASLDSVEQ